ncbi:MAG: murein biosynthesis integral membrane protein MurJ [Aquificota bacterium]|nr:murein biosynthesis integral membrane protein MurJ [Aquificota bacterium]
MNALFMGILNVRGRFFIPAFSQGVFNALFVLVLLLFAEPYGYLSLIAGVLLGGLFQVLVNVPLLIRERAMSFSLSLSFDEEVKTLLRRLLPALGGFGVNQLSLFIDTFLASFLRTGAISYLYYANRLYQLPFGIVSVGVANSLLSILSRRSVNRRRELTEALRLVFLLTLPASAGLFPLSEGIVSVVYGRGNFAEEDVFFSSGALSIYSLGLVPFSFQKVLSAVLFSVGDTKAPVKASLLTVLSEGVLASIFAFLLGMGVFGLPAGTAMSSLVGFFYLISKVDTSPDWLSLLKSFLKGFLATAIMSALVLFLKSSELEPFVLVLTAVPRRLLLTAISADNSRGGAKPETP